MSVAPATSADPRQPAREPNDLGRFFLERVNAGDLDGLVALYEPDAVLEFPPGIVVVGHEQIRRVYSELLAARPRLEPGVQAPALAHGDLALTSTRLTDGGATAEIARRQADGTWLWAVDQPTVR
ncbi:nuclear transport factor 2 family protein [Isoptericola cucumis]|uniref:YybH family protein n=1 Tax=Isoptericola cucumis TaxID=1776856 RepID=UPI0032081D93